MVPEEIDPKTLHYIYLQAVDEVISGNQPISREHAIQLMALQMYVDQVKIFYFIFVCICLF